MTVAFAADQKKIDAQVKAITKSAILIDTHNDIPSFTIDGADIANSPKNHTDIPRLREGGVGAIFFSVFVDAKYVAGNHSANRALQIIDTVYHDIIDRYPNDFSLALTADDIERAHREHKIGALLGIEGGHAIEDSPRLLRDYYKLGVRYMTLTHFNTNNWADSSGDINDPKIQHHNGLTPSGKDIVREMNRLGMMVDISHVADKTFWDAIAITKAPVIASHSSARALSNHPRNMTDEMLQRSLDRINKGSDRLAALAQEPFQIVGRFVELHARRASLPVGDRPLLDQVPVVVVLVGRRSRP